MAVALPGNQRPPKSSAITFKVISTFVMDMMMPQGMQKITARKTVELCERQDTIRKAVIHTTIQDDSRAGVGWESADTGSAQGNRDEEDGEVYILGNLSVTPHEAGVDILAVNKG